MPVIGFLGSTSAQVTVKDLEAFRKGLSETGYVEGHRLLHRHGGFDGRSLDTGVLRGGQPGRSSARAGEGLAAAAQHAVLTAVILIVVGVALVYTGIATLY